MRVACVILQPSVANKDVILERKPSNKDQNSLSSGPPPVIHKQVGFQVNIRDDIFELRRKILRSVDTRGYVAGT